MKNINHFTWSAFVAVTALALTGCGRSGGNFPGREYMPDMAHSIAYEANVYGYYSNNRWGTEAEYRKAAEPRTPVEGTVSRKDTRWDFRQERYAKIYPVYHYPNTEDARTLAQAEILDNPIKPQTEGELKEILAKGKLHYDTYCGVCHGEKGDGNGVLWNSGQGPYKAAPASYLNDDLLGSSDGRYYHAIMHGKNKMLSHADKLSFEERWQVIHHIRSLQATSKGGKYDLATANRQNKAPKIEEAEGDKGGEKPKEVSTR